MPKVASQAKKVEKVEKKPRKAEKPKPKSKSKLQSELQLQSQSKPQLQSKSQLQLQSKETPRTFQEFVEEAQQQQKKHGKSQNTSTSYQYAVSRTKKWLSEFVEKAGDAGQLFQESREFVDLLGDGQDDEDEGDDDASIPQYQTMPKDFATCLDGCPTSTTPLVITLFMYTKCFKHGKGNSTAWQIYAGWKYHYDQMCEGKYRGRWREDRERNEWVGNPTSSPLVTDMLAACKNKDGETERKHSRAMSIEDMTNIFLWSWNICPDNSPVTTTQERALKTEHLFFRAFISVAFTLWTRNCETSTLKAKDIDWVTEPRPNAPQGDPPAINIRLRERKGWQRKQSKGETQLNVPAETTKKKVNKFATDAGLPGAGRYTTHCFRCGGAQYRFMFAPIGQRWTLAMVRWWGGWSPNERHDTLVRYLLDELHTYEQDHSDALYPTNLERANSYLGEAAEQAPLKTSEARLLFSELKTWWMDQAHAYYPGPQNLYSVSHLSPSQCPQSSLHYHLNPSYPSPYPYPSLQPVTQYIPSNHMNPSQISAPTGFYPHGPVSIGSNSYSPVPSYTQTQPILDTSFLLQVPRIPSGLSNIMKFRQLVKDWEEGDPHRQLPYALKDWKKEWYTRKEVAAIYGQRWKVALEFIETYDRDEASFLMAYPEYERGIKALHDAILTRQIDDSEAKA
ncbi:hypothetical protein K435DRAFT_862637 [Dendrothele bispora CBS 962.96]|uniref:Uncharacterized protein n=1 Tax=Dendrothele bispora (strain CBS 962.96) TaxID=1314807 RepID=A0A4S8LS94_DENBC|nr:hypothetical protein K435DRAFT_862637 [Dendrothele bispora CBS 962.96]